MTTLRSISRCTLLMALMTLVLNSATAAEKVVLTAEDGKTAVRGARRDARKDLEALQKDGDITEDQLRRSEEELDKMTKRHEAEIDAALESKTVELMEG